MSATDRPLENAIVRLLRRAPFYGYLLVGLKRRQESCGRGTGITISSGAPTLVLDHDLFAACSPQEQEALLEHCLKHLLHLHPSRRKERNRHDWDIACDLAVNPSVESLPAAALQPAYFALPEGLAAEEYYRRLTDPFDCGSLAGSGAGNAGDDGAKPEIDTGENRDGQSPLQSAAATPLDNHAIWEEADSIPLRLAEEVVRSMVRDAVQQCAGQLPAGLSPLVTGMLAPPPIPWKMVLRQFVATAGRVGRKSSWQRENRRFAHTTPGCIKEHRLHLLVGVDVSDSTDAPELREAFAAELLRIVRGRRATVTVLYANSRVRRIERLQGESTVVSVYHGGGFTDLRPVFDHARSMHPRPAAVIYLTDGIGPAPEKMELPTLWVLTKEGERPVPWGVELRLEV